MDKEKLKRAIKSFMPWRLRYFIKLQEAKGNIHISEGIKQFRTIEQYNDELYDTLRDLKIDSFKGKTVCELGPGQHLSHAFLEYQMGAEKEFLLEIADFAHVDSAAVLKNVVLKNGYDIQKRIPNLQSGESWISYLDKINARYFTNGIAGYKSMLDNSVDFCFSYAVFEHIRKNIFVETLQEIYRFMNVGGICYHTVDFTDHMGGGKNQLRFPDSVWENEVHYKMDMYTNRISCTEMCVLMEEIGFEILALKRQKYKKIPLKRNKINNMFRDINEEDLFTSNAIIVAKKNHKNA